jgi:vacuolar-type H+-ATPase subunit H
LPPSWWGGDKDSVLKEEKVFTMAKKDATSGAESSLGLLRLIREKEQKLKLKVLETRAETEQMISKAEDEAKRIEEEAVVEGKKLGEELLRKGLEAAQERVSQIEKEAEKEIARVKEQGRKKKQQLVNLVFDLVMPEEVSSKSN